MTDAGETSAQSLIDEALFRPVRSGNAFEDTVARLLQTVRLGIVAPGEALPSERDLALRLAVSRDTVRDAIKELAAAGYLVSRRGRYGGTFVSETLPHPEADESAPLGRVELEDTLGLREVLEVGAARIAARRSLAASEREELWARLEETAAAASEDYRRLDSRLHLAIAEVSGAPSLVGLVADSRSRVNALLDRIPLLATNIAHSNAQHEAIIGAILRGDERVAEEAMLEHLEGSAALLRGFLA
jgi:GntR family transcriptional regulator, transcriptional repressor for pyruvate dehydrogenase complex